MFNGALHSSTGKASTGWQKLSYGFQLSGMMQYYSTLPLNLTTGTTTVQGTAGRPLVDGAYIDRNAGSGSDFFGLNLRASRTFALTEHVKMEAIYHLSAAKTGYVRPQPRGRVQQEFVAVVSDENPVAAVSIKLLQYASVHGAVLDAATGTPVAKIRVAAFAVYPFQGKWMIAPTGNEAATNDRGEFRINDLAPGPYLFETNPSGMGPSLTAAVSGIKPDPEKHTIGYARSHWPGPQYFQAISILSGSRHNVGNIHVTKSDLFSIQGILIQDGCPDGGSALLHLFQIKDGTFQTRGRAKIGCNQHFSFDAFQPGSYELEGTGTDPASPGEVLRSHQSILVTNRSVSVDVSLRRGVAVAGMIRWPDSTPATARILPAGVKMRAKALSSGNSRWLDAKVSGEGTFSLDGLSAGIEYEIQMHGLPAGLYCKQFRYNKAVLPTDRLRLSNSVSPHQIDVDIGTQPARIRGTVRDGERVLANSTVALLISPLQSETIFDTAQFSRTGMDGSFDFGFVKPGDYRLVAVVDADAGRLDEPTVLERLALLDGEEIHVGDLQQKTATIRAGNLGRR